MLIFFSSSEIALALENCLDLSRSFQFYAKFFDSSRLFSFSFRSLLSVHLVGSRVSYVILNGMI